ncbi:uncharacterized protein LOC129765127 isoform X1 [Toxorhynchites rutilus septentrionalis]|uniref:uncharacterized protein LOC129765126 isoform X1 n=1 Tax=Toxorhynchites rutilus septentrionalis TaxID=329112 RepID=UPI00247B21F2|nr:uncharacterized protein LOC129765126 isoform X1 [Toxorhynchites rutilus septentrionalis]XP_055620990.1 uncharacterized protein LOC129765127 isoform X1 [Toxorhynchites rutilus septentrionalis]
MCFFFNSHVRADVDVIHTAYCGSERNAMGPSGGSPSSWDYFDILHSFLHTYKQNSTRDLMDEVIGSDDDYCDAEYLDEAYNPENDTFAQSMFMSPSAPTSSVSSPSPTLPSSSRRHSAPKKRKQNVQEKLLELAIKENENMVTFMEHSKTTDLQIIELMKENNALMSKLVDKI